MGTSGVSLDKNEIIEAIYEKKGKITHAAKKLGCHFQTIYDWRDKDPEVAAAIIEARKIAENEHQEDILDIKDLMYKALKVKIETGDATSIIYAMKTFGGHADGSGSIKIIYQEPTCGKNDRDTL